MSKPTGPGKCQELPRGKDARIRHRALLFNFDIDGDELKAEHKQYLDRNIAPLLQQTVSLNVTVRGLASRSGSAAHNKALSLRRAANVKRYLQDHHGTGAWVEAAGEDEAALAGQADGTEDALYRGAVVIVSAARKASFEQPHPQFKDNGFDATTNPRWLMVPHDLPRREVRVLNGAGCFIRSRNPGVAVPVSVDTAQPLTQIVSDSQVLAIQGLLPGTTTIDVVTSGGAIVGSLDVSVLVKRQVTIAFRYLQHPEAGTQRQFGLEGGVLRELNAIYQPQANIEFVYLDSRILRLDDDFGEEINIGARLANGRSEWDQVTRHRHPEARITVFFVREFQEWEEEGYPDNADAMALAGTRDCLVEDRVDRYRETIAHECGHCLGVLHESPPVATQPMLMYSHPDRTGRFIPKEHVYLMRHFARE